MQNNSILNFANKNNYNVDYLTDGSPIFQVANSYHFTSDSVLLANFATERNKLDCVVDLCAGSGIVGLQLDQQINISKLYFVELDKQQSDVCKYSCQFSKTKSKKIVINKDLKLINSNDIKYNTVDVVVCNPPYFKIGNGYINLNNNKASARHEINVTLEDIFIAVKKLLKQNGIFYMIHIFDRINDIKLLAKKYNFKIINSKQLSGKLSRILVSCINENL